MGIPYIRPVRPDPPAPDPTIPPPLQMAPPGQPPMGGNMPPSRIPGGPGMGAPAPQQSAVQRTLGNMSIQPVSEAQRTPQRRSIDPGQLAIINALRARIAGSAAGAGQQGYTPSGTVSQGSYVR